VIDIQFRKIVYTCTALCCLAHSRIWAQVPLFTISTVAGNGTTGFAGDGSSATQAELNNPCKIAVNNAGTLTIADQANARIRKVSGGTINTVAGNGTNGYTGDGGPATQANISLPCGVAIDSSSNVFFSQVDAINSAVRKAPASGNISTITGTTLGAGFSGDGLAATGAQVNAPIALALDSSGNLYIADALNHRIRVIGNNGTGTINTVAGNGTAQYAGDGGIATSASLNDPEGIAVDSSGNLYIADTRNHCIRKVSGNVITTFAGTCTVSGFAGDGGQAAKARLNYPKDVAVDAAGNVYIADTYNWRIRIVTPNGVISTIAGTSRPGYTGDGGLATRAELNFPEGIALGPGGTVYISDTQNNVIRLLTPGNGGPTVTPPLISSIVTASACGGFSSVAPGAWIEIHGTGLAADTRQWAASDFVGTLGPTSLDGTQVSVGGQHAVVMYISATQVNAQVPLSVGLGQQPVAVTDANGTSPAATVTVNSFQPGLCQSFQFGGNEYLAAVVNGTSTYVLPSTANLSGLTSRPAHPGELISFFGNGFGAVAPNPGQSQTVQQSNQLVAPLEIYFGQTRANVQYAGLAPGYIGLYQFNVVVPNIPDNDAVPVSFDLGNFAGAPTLYTAVKAQ